MRGVLALCKLRQSSPGASRVRSETHANTFIHSIYIYGVPTGCANAGGTVVTKTKKVPTQIEHSG